MSIAIASEMIFTPMMVNDIFNALKNKAVSIKNKAVFSTLYKLLDVAREEMYKNNLDLESNLENFTISDIKKMDTHGAFESNNDSMDKLWELHETLENSTDPYEIQFFNLVDEILDHMAKFSNLVTYLSTKLTMHEHNLKVS